MTYRLIRESIRQILREAEGAGKIDELISRLESINTQIEKYYTDRALAAEDDLDPDNIPRFGVHVDVNAGSSGRVLFVVKGATYTGDIEPNSTLWISGEGNASLIGNALGLMLPSGMIVFGSKDQNPCLDAWSVQHTLTTTKGWGPLLYDIAIEIATQEAGGLMPDRNEVSDAANSVWYAYNRSRPDVEKVQLDISDDDLFDWAEKGEGNASLKRLTPDVSEDDCTQQSAIQDRKGDADWFNSPLSRVYRKPPTTISRLESMGLLFRGSVGLG